MLEIDFEQKLYSAEQEIQTLKSQLIEKDAALRAVEMEKHRQVAALRDGMSADVQQAHDIRESLDALLAEKDAKILALKDELETQRKHYGPQMIQVAPPQDDPPPIMR